MSDVHFSKFDISAFQQRINKSDSLDAKRDMWASLAKSAEKCERYEDMCVFTSEIVNLVTGAGEDLSSEERNLLSVAYKNVIGARRQSWRTIVQDEQTDDRDDLQEFKQQLESELVSISVDILAQLEDKLNPVAEKNSANNDSKVFYLKMIGDYYRYLAESVFNRHESPAPFDPSVSDIDALKDQVKTVAGDLGADAFEKKYGISADKIQGESDAAAVQAMVRHCLRHVLDYAEQAQIYYQKAYDIATEELKPTHPIRLGLALNFSVCHFEILKNKKAACDLAKSAFDEAIAKLDNLEESDYKDSTLIMQLLRDNLTLWTSNDEGSEEDMGLEDVSGDEAV